MHVKLSALNVPKYAGVTKICMDPRAFPQKRHWHHLVTFVARLSAHVPFQTRQIANVMALKFVTSVCDAATKLRAREPAVIGI